jgi:hypothetical protein
LADDWLDPKKRRSVENRLKESGIDSKALYAIAFSLRIDSLESAERMLAAKEIRLNNIMRGLEERRQRPGYRLRGREQTAIACQPERNPEAAA